MANLAMRCGVLHYPYPNLVPIRYSLPRLPYARAETQITTGAKKENRHYSLVIIHLDGTANSWKKKYDPTSAFCGL